MPCEPSARPKKSDARPATYTPPHHSLPLPRPPTLFQPSTGEQYDEVGQCGGSCTGGGGEADDGVPSRGSGAVVIFGAGGRPVGPPIRLGLSRVDGKPEEAIPVKDAEIPKRTSSDVSARVG